MHSHNLATSLRRVILSSEPFIALAVMLMSLHGISAFESVDLGLLGRGLAGILVILCVSIVIDQIQLLRGEDPLQA